MVFFLVDALLLGIPAAWIWREKKFNLQITKKKIFTVAEALGFKKETWKETLKKTIILFVLLLYTAFIVGSILFVLGLNDTHLVQEKVQELLLSPLTIAYILVVRVSAEEIFFRGFLTQKIGILWSSVLFAAAHYSYGSIAEIIGAFLLGILLAAYFQRSKSLLPNILAHVMYNLVIFSLLV